MRGTSTSERRPRIRSWLPGLIAVALAPAPLRAKEVCPLPPHQPSRPSAFFENDVLWLSGRSGDKFYTTGVRISTSSVLDPIPPANPNDFHKPPHGIWPFGHLFDRGYCFARGWGIGLNIYTPRKLDTELRQPLDRPYAGHLHGLYTLDAFRDEDTKAELRHLEVAAGIVGPGAGAQFFQNCVHSVINVDKSKGWHTQLQNEPGFYVLYAQHRLLHFPPKDGGWGWDLSAHHAEALGNVFTFAGAGGTLRAGRNLRRDLGPVATPASAPAGKGGGGSWFEAYAFVRPQARLVFRNEFLDGEFFRLPTQSVDKYPAMADLETGVSLRLFWARLTWRTVLRTPEFREQRGAQRFGSLNLALLECGDGATGGHSWLACPRGTKRRLALVIVMTAGTALALRAAH